MNINTHHRIDRRLCGNPTAVAEGYSRVELTTISEMATDDSGLVHGGFIFGVADYAAMLAVNHPHVVLGGAEVKFLKPVAVNEEVIAEAKVGEAKGKKKVVKVTVKRGDNMVFEGLFICFVLEKHVLPGRTIK